MKLEEKIKYIPLVMFFLSFTKAMFISPSWMEVTVMAVLGSAAAFYQFFCDEKRFKVLHARMDVADQHLTELYKVNEDLKNRIMGVTVGQGLRSTTIFGNKS